MKLTNLYILLATTIALTSCAKTGTMDGEATSGPSIQFNIKTINPSSRALPQENAVEDIYVFFFKVSNNTLHQVTKVQDVINSGANGKSFAVNLNTAQSEDELFDSYVLANVGDFMEGKDPAFFEGRTYADFRELLEATIIDGIQGGIVMSGKGRSRVGAQGGEKVTVPMLRALASLDIGVGTGAGGYWDGRDGSGVKIPFKLSNISVYNSRDTYAFMPLEALYDADLTKVSAPTLAGQVKALPLEYEVPNGLQITQQIYLPEADVLMKKGAFSGDENHLNRCAIVIAGYYANATSPTYYRIDFNDNNTPKQLVNVLRNHKYTVNIVSVTGPGAISKEEAMKANPLKVNMIVQWQDIDSSLDLGGGLEVGSEDKGGVIFWGDPEDPDGHYKVAAKVDQPSVSWAFPVLWGQTPPILVAVGASSLTNGRYNMEKIIAFSRAAQLGATGVLSVDFPAANACHTYRGPEGTDPVGSWYLPAIDEIFDVYKASDKIAQADAQGWISLNPGVNDYWSSSEVYNTTQNVWFVRLVANEKNPGAAKYELGGGIRCIRDVTTPAQVGQERLGGSVFWVDPADPTVYKVVAKEDQISVAEMINFASPALINVKFVPTAQDHDNGYLNQLAIIAFSNSKQQGATGDLNLDYPVVASCYNYKGPAGTDVPGTWYLPAINELKALCDRKDGLDVIDPEGWAPIIRVSGYFSSTENSDNPSLMWWIGMGNNSTHNSGRKGDNGTIRCIRKS